MAEDLAAMGDQTIVDHLAGIGAELFWRASIGSSCPAQVKTALLIDVVVIQPTDMGIDLDIVPDDPIDHRQVVFDQLSLRIGQCDLLIHWYTSWELGGQPARLAMVGAQGNDPVALIVRKAADMGLRFGQAKRPLQPPVRLLFAQRTVPPDSVKDLMSLNPLPPKRGIRQCSHGQPAFSVCAHIGIAVGILGADVVQRIWISGRLTKQIPAAAAHNGSAAVWTV